MTSAQEVLVTGAGGFVCRFVVQPYSKWAQGDRYRPAIDDTLQQS
jgi:hypothetical protein